MAIQNASDLLVYKKVSSSAVAQITQFFIKSSNNSPLNAVTSNVTIKNSTNASGVIQSDQQVAVTTNTDLGLANALKTAIVNLPGNAYAVTNVTSNDGGRVFKASNTFAGDLDESLQILNGVSANGNPGGILESGAVDVTVITPGSNANEYEPIAFSTSASISFNRDLRDVTTKDSAGWSESAIGLKSFEMTTDALQDYSSDLNFQQFVADLSSGDAITLRFKQRTSSGNDEFYQGTAIVSSLSIEAGVEDNLTYSVTFTGTASVTTGTD